VGYPSGLTTKPEDATVDYIIANKGSSFTARVFATGLLSSFGHSPTITIADFEGTVCVNPETIENSSLRMVLRAGSLAVNDDLGNGDREEIDRRMHVEALESESFPEIVYECTRLSASKTGEGQYWVALNGDLTLHGVTRSQPVSARISINGDALRAIGDFSVRQSDYQIRPVSALGGTVRLKDEIKLSFAINAHRQGESSASG
jgi:polyisoprenoid-binding protein YceI